MAESQDTSRNEVEIDLDKYMSLIDKLDEQEDKIKEMQEEARKARDQLAPPKRKMIKRGINFFFITFFVENLLTPQRISILLISISTT